MMGRLRIVNELLDPIIEFLRYLSPTAMIPIAVIWFGIGEQSKYFLIFWGTFFFVLINTIAGVMRTPVARAARGAVPRRERAADLPDRGRPFGDPVHHHRNACGDGVLLHEHHPCRDACGPVWPRPSAAGVGMLAQTDRIFVALAAISLLGFLTDRLFRFLAHRTLNRYMAFVSVS